MATAGDGNPPYQSTGAGGKFRKNQFRRNIKTTPYDRPIIINKIQNPSLLTKIVNPASRLIYAGANKLFGAFRNRLLPSEINEEPKNVLQVAEKSENSASIAVATGISELEQMLQQKTFTRSEIQRLTALLHSRTAESPSDDVVERDGAKLHSSPSPFLRLEASTSGSLKRHGDERDNFHAAISTPAVSSKALEDKIASPAELAKAYMGSRPITSSAMRQDMKLLTNASGLPKTPIASFASKTTTNGFKGLENGFVTPRSRGRSAMYSMARTPYARSSSTSTQKGIGSNYGHGATLTSQSAFGREGKTAIKRRSSVLDDDIGSGGPLRRTRQKANLLSQRDKRELGYTAFQQSDTTGQKLLLMSGSEPEDLQRAKLNGDTFMHGSGYASVPTKSTQTATKILQHLEKPSPKENNSGSAESPTKLTLDMLHGKALRSLEKVDLPKLLYYPHDSEKSEAPQQARIHASREPASKGKDKIEENGSRHDRRESTFKGKEKIEENGSSKFPSPCSIFTSVNGEVPVSLKDNAPNVTITHSPLKVPSESPQKKRAFQMSAPDDSFEIDDDEVQVNGHVSFPLVENKKPDTSLVANKLAAADSIESPKLPEVPKTALVVNNESVSTEVAKIPEQAELKEAENATSSKTNYGLFSEPGRGMKLPPSPPSTTTAQTSVPLQSNVQTEKVAPEKVSSPSSFLFGTTVEKESPFQFSIKEPSVFKLDATSDPIAPESNSVISSVPKNDHVKFSVSNKEDNGNGNDQNSANMLGKSELKSSAVPLAASTNGTFSFGNPTNNASTPNASSALNAPAFPSTNGTFSFGNPANNASTPNAASASDAPALASLVPVQASGTNTNSLFSNISPNVTSASTSTPISTTTTTATAATTSLFSTSVSFPVFSFGSTATPTSMAETGNNTNATNDNERRSNTSSLPLITTSFATTTTTMTTGSGLFGFSSPSVASTTTAPSQGSFFSVTNGSQANTSASTAVTQSAPFQFGSGSSSSSFGAPTPAFAASTPAFGASATPAFGASATPAFGASAPAFGASATPAFGASAPAFGSSAPTFGSSPSFGLMAASSEGKSSNTTSGSTTSIFGSTWQAPQSSGSGSTLGLSPSPVFSFGASSTPMPSTTTSPIVFGASNTAASFMTTGATNSSFSGPVFGNPAPVFGAATLSPNNNDQMSMEDSMAEDSMHTPSPVSAFGQAPAGAPGFMFGSGTPTPTPTAGSYQFAGQPNQTPPQNPFQSSSVEFNAGGGSFSLGSGGDKSGRRIVRVKNKNRRKVQ